MRATPSTPATLQNCIRTHSLLLSACLCVTIRICGQRRIDGGKHQASPYMLLHRQMLMPHGVTKRLSSVSWSAMKTTAQPSTGAASRRRDAPLKHYPRARSSCEESNLVVVDVSFLLALWVISKRVTGLRHGHPQSRLVSTVCSPRFTPLLISPRLGFSLRQRQIGPSYPKLACARGGIQVRMSIYAVKSFHSFVAIG